MVRAKISEIKVISKPGQKYCGWPTLARRANGELLAVCSGGREAHVCPFGQVHLMRSTDGGAEWSGPEILADGPLDDRDAGVMETGKGTILVNWFTSCKWESLMDENLRGGAAEGDNACYRTWAEARKKLTADVRARELGHWLIRSEDGGRTWSGKINSVANSPHGPVELSDGRLFFAGKKAAGPGEGTDAAVGSPHAPEIGAAVSDDDGRTWKWLSSIKPAPGHDAASYHELHAVETAGGKIIAQIRNHNSSLHYETLQCESADGGFTWSRPRSTGVWGFPSHLIRLPDGRIMMTYGHRREPWGVQARVSGDEGASWPEEIIILGEGEPRDLGYPSTVQVPGGGFITVWYERTEAYSRDKYYEQTHPSGGAVLKMARWEFAER